jgi:hypothetical protein
VDLDWAARNCDHVEPPDVKEVTPHFLSRSPSPSCYQSYRGSNKRRSGGSMLDGDNGSDDDHDNRTISVALSYLPGGGSID